jgi:hypothetical protein
VPDRRDALELRSGTKQSAGLKACPMLSASRITAWTRPSSDLVPRGSRGRAPHGEDDGLVPVVARKAARR